MKTTIKLMPGTRTIEAEAGEDLFTALRRAGAAPEGPCGGRGACGKCRVLVNGEAVLACRTAVRPGMSVVLPEAAPAVVLTAGCGGGQEAAPRREGYLLAFDIGTTTLACYLLDGRTGVELAASSMLNPQAPYGADVITRIQAALGGELETLGRILRDGMSRQIREVCGQAGVNAEEISVVSVVGNPCMQQLFLGIPPDNLAAVPFAPVLTRAAVRPAGPLLPMCRNASLLVVPDISGYIGADTIGCVLSTGLYESEETVLLVDIGTNGEMVLGGKDRMIACAAAAGPALEGASIRFGMRGAAGAVDHVWLDGGALRYSVIGGGEAAGFCGSGLIDAAAAALDAGLLNRRGRIQTEETVDGERVIRLTDTVYLTQEDIRQLQLAKGAIAAGVELMAEQMGLALEQIDRVLLAGAFGSYLRPESACRIGLLPPVLLGKITAVGNAAGSGAKLLACGRPGLELTQELAERIAFLELAQLPAFRRTFARNIGFSPEI